jgi:AcrR family transcriptional regulator
LAATTLTGIATLAGVNRNVVYDFFHGDLQEVLVSACEILVGHIAEGAVADGFESGDRTGLEMVAESSFEVFAGDPALAHLLLLLVVGAEPSLARNRERLVLSPLRTLARDVHHEQVSDDVIDSLAVGAIRRIADLAQADRMRLAVTGPLVSRWFLSAIETAAKHPSDASHPPACTRRTVDVDDPLRIVVVPASASRPRIRSSTKSVRDYPTRLARPWYGRP